MTRRLKVKRPFGLTLLLAGAAAALLVGGAELFFRSPLARTVLPAPSYGIGHQNLDLKFAQLAALQRRGDLPDCILLGSSMVDADIDPAVLGDAILDGSGPALECYNFGIGGLTLPSTEKLVKVLTGLFAPRALVLGIGPLDMEGQHVRIPWQRSADRIDASPWISYRLGQFSLPGWLVDHLWSYRYFLRFRQWLEWPSFSWEVSVKEETSAAGFNNRRQPKGFQHPKGKEDKIRTKLENFAVAEERLENIEGIAKERRGKALIFIEIPVHPVVRRLFPGGEAVARQAMERAAAKAAALEVPVIRLEAGAFGDELLWRDYYHLNTRGATAYSRWLGTEMAKVLRERRRPKAGG